MKEVLYKWTDKNGRSGAQESRVLTWGEDVTHRAIEPVPPSGCVLCTPTVIHAYRTPQLAMLCDPIHAGYGALHKPQLWKSEGVVYVDGGFKVGCRQLTTLEEVEWAPVLKWRSELMPLECLRALEPKEEIFTYWAKRKRVWPSVRLSAIPHKREVTIVEQRYPYLRKVTQTLWIEDVFPALRKLERVGISAEEAIVAAERALSGAFSP